MDQNEKLHKLTVVLAHCQIKVNLILQKLEKFLFARKWKNVFYIVLELIFYFLFAALIIGAMLIPSDPLQYKKTINESSKIELSYHQDQITAFIVLVKLVFVLCASGFLFGAVFSRKARRRGYVIKEMAGQLKSVSEELNAIGQ